MSGGVIEGVPDEFERRITEHVSLELIKHIAGGKTGLNTSDDQFKRSQNIVDRQMSVIVRWV